MIEFDFLQYSFSDLKRILIYIYYTAVVYPSAVFLCFIFMIHRKDFISEGGLGIRRKLSVYYTKELIIAEYCSVL